MLTVTTCVQSPLSPPFVLHSSLLQDGRVGYNVRKLVKQQKQVDRDARKRKRSAQDDETAAPESFQIDTADDRFGALFADPEFAIDPTVPEFKNTAAMQKLLSERQRRRAERRSAIESSVKRQKLQQEQQQPDLSSLVNKLKSKAIKK